MSENITNLVLLEHMQAMKADLLQQVKQIRIDLTTLDYKVDTLSERVERGFEEARKHRQELQEDLDATIRMFMKHDKKLARLQCSA
jgi:hypothetical protein